MSNDKKFAFAIDGEIFHVISIPDTEEFQASIAGFRSGPSVIEVTGIDNISNTWRVIDNVLYRPVFESASDGPGYELDD